MMPRALCASSVPLQAVIRVKKLVPMTAFGVILALAGSLLIQSLSRAKTRTDQLQTTIDSKGTINAWVADFQAQSAAVALAENEEIVFAEFTFECELPIRTEVEVWPALEGETPPWELTGESVPFIRNSWITDERTGALVRFDVTDLVRAWEAGALPNLGFVVRVLDDGDAESQSQTNAAVPTVLPSVKGASLTYHIEAVRPPKVDDVTIPDKSPLERTPRSEHQVGDPH